MSQTAQQIPAKEWLLSQIEEGKKRRKTHLNIPQRSDGKDYLLSGLRDDQKEIVVAVMGKLKDWIERADHSKFKPLRMIIKGAGGSGKSVLINTIVALVRRMFGRNDVVNVIAPTGSAAFGVSGETAHSFFSMSKREYVPGSLAGETKQKLLQRMEHMLALICDERSLLSCETLGTCAQKTREAIYDGRLCSEDWGGIPVVILVGDDYQLPSVDPGAFDVLDWTIKSRRPKKMECVGINCWKEFGNDVMELKGNKRCRENDAAGEICKRARTGDTTKEDCKKILSLDLRNIGRVHGWAEVKKIKEKALFLFANRAPAAKMNYERLAETQSKDNPVCSFCCESKGNSPGGRAKSGHFDDNQIPPSCLCCRGAKVAITGRNFYPLWGLHNGAYGTVVDVIFKDGCNPCRGDLPEYAIIDLPCYCGPAWDMNNPTVSTNTV